MRSILLPIRIVLVGLAASPFAPGQVTTRVSLTWNQEQVSAIVDFRSALSADGRFVALSANSSLAPINTFANKEVFVRDRQTGTVDLVSRATSGALSNGFSNLGDMSADGRFVVFESAASTLVAGDTNGTHDIFLRDRQLGATVCVSVNSLGAPANDSSARPTVSADGRFVCFQSYATDLVAGDTNAAPDVFVRDMLLGSTERVSLSSVGAQVALGGENPHISGDGRCVLFTSLDANVVPGDLNTLRDSFVRDRQAGTTTLVSLGSAGGPAHSDCNGEAISGDGRFVTFSSWDGTLVPGDTNHDYDVFVRDTLAGTTECASVDSAGNLGDGRSSQSALSADGRYVAFESIATNLVPGSPALSSGVFVHDRLTGATLLASIDSGGNPAEDFSISQQPAISGDGSTVAFLSDATNLVEGDTNHAPDLFVRGSAPPPVVFCPGDGSIVPCPCGNQGASGRGCANSAVPAGALLSASGNSSLSSDTLVLQSSGEPASVLSIFLQGDRVSYSVPFGDGRRCVGGHLSRLFLKTSATGTAVAPAPGDPSISSRAISLGDALAPGSQRCYQAYYRDPSTSFCPLPQGNTFNISSGLVVVWRQ